ncbi:DsbA family protein [Jiella marina]|uniref:DsbA family protein n=1 Tax=Jiella sp. LLJ827 TaxID=2917712 RepID=UPI0021010D3A|nr:DsbA family protein [Jiella sp. LLJ827]MCQ0988325.1 DsbA family protein [Jiella sp. LLJ827]
MSPVQPATRRTTRLRLTVIAAAVSGLALAACSDTEENSANALVNAEQPIKLAQASLSDSATSETASTVEAPASEGSVDMEALMAEGPLPDIVIGDEDAPVTIVEYASMTCSHCRDFHENSYPALKEEYLDTGKAKLIVREFPFDPRALAAFMLARCAGDDAKRTAMVDVMFQQQSEWAYADNASAALLKIARLAGMSQDDFKACLNDTELQKKIVETQQRGENEFGVSATPTFFVNGDKYAGALSAEQMGAVIENHM